MIETDLSSKDIEDAEALRPEPEVPPTTAELVAGGEVEPVIQAGEEEQVAGLGSAIKALKGTKVAPPIKRVTEEQADSFLERQAVGRIVDPARTDQRNFSLKYINDPEDIDNELNRLMDDMAEEMEFGSYPGMEARSHEQTKEDAKKVQVDIEKFIGRKLRSAPENAAELTIWRQMLLDSARELKDMSGKLIDPATGQRSMNASDADLYEFRQAMYRYSAIQMKLQGAVKEVGRMLNAMKIPIGADPLAGQDMTSILLSEGQGIHGTLKMAGAVYNAQTPEEVAALARGTFLQRAGNIGYEVWINGLLSGFGTHVKNFAGNSITAILALPEHYLAAGIGKVLNSEDRILAAETNAMAYGLWQGSIDGLQIALRNFFKADGSPTVMEQITPNKLEWFRKPEFTAENMGLREDSVLGSAVDMIGHWYVRLPGRVLQSTDDLYRSIGYRMNLNAAAYRKALEEGLVEGSEEFNSRIANILMEPPEEMVNQAVEFAQYQTFTNELTGPVSRGVQMMAKNPVMKVFLPFIRTPLNILKYSTARTPIAPVMPSVWKDLQAGGRKRDLAMSRIALGSVMSYSFVSMMTGTDENGNYRPRITGAPPSNPTIANLWREAGIQPYSIWDEDDQEWVPYNWIEPFGTQIANMADMVLIYNSVGDPQQRENIAMAMATAIAEYTTDKSYVQGFGQMLQLLTGPDRFGAIKRLPSSAVPTWLRNIRKDVDPWKRETKHVAHEGAPGTAMGGMSSAVNQMVAYIRNSSPWHSSDLMPATDVWGKDIAMGNPLWIAHSLSPAMGHALQYERATAHLIQNNIGARDPSPVITVETKYGNVKIDILTMEDGDRLYYDYRQIVGQQRLQQVNSVINSGGYDRTIVGEDRAILLSQAMDAGLTAARDMFKSAFREELMAQALATVQNRKEYRDTIIPGMEP